MNSSVWHYDKLALYNQDKYKDVLTANMIVGDEISIKNKDLDVMEYFYVLKKGEVNFLLESKYIDELPLKIKDCYKMSFRSKGYMKITLIKSVRAKPKRTMSYKQMIDSWLPFKHEEPLAFTVFKIITDVAYSRRINIRCMSYPGWLKDSPLVSLAMIRGDCSTVNKPTFAKLKYLLSGGLKVLGINEAQGMESKDRRALSRFYEDVGDFKPYFVFDSRKTDGTKEGVELTNLSSMTFYNFPEDDDGCFDEQFHAKIRSRLLPFLLPGGSNTDTACKESFDDEIEGITEQEKAFLDQFLANHVHYAEDKESGLDGKEWTPKHKFKNTRWNRNYTAICTGLRRYADNEEEFNTLEEMLFKMVSEYMDWVNQRKAKEVFKNE